MMISSPSGSIRSPGLATAIPQPGEASAPRQAGSPCSSPS